ncbi:MAG: polysaccharide deacetylase family protein [Pseudomonadota bacterium]
MALDPSYLEYPRRREGMDHDLYTPSNIFERPDFFWPGGKRVAVWIVVNLEWFPMEPSDTPFRAPGHMQTPYPDYRHYTARDYGSRVGAWRILEALKTARMPASFAVNAAIAERYPELLAAVNREVHEVIAHSTDMNGTIAGGLPEAEERALILEARDTLTRLTGSTPKGWASIARSQSFNTLKLLAEAGFEYQCDWPNDDLPYGMTTPAGPIGNMPLNHELSDRQIMLTQQHSTESYVEQIKDAYAWLSREAVKGGPRILPLNVTPYIMGLPYRIDAFEELLGWLKGRQDAWCARGDIIFRHWKASTSDSASAPTA